jgi:hypothetical protein
LLLGLLRHSEISCHLFPHPVAVALSPRESPWLQLASLSD